MRSDGRLIGLGVLVGLVVLLALANLTDELLNGAGRAIWGLSLIGLLVGVVRYVERQPPNT